MRCIVWDSLLKGEIYLSWGFDPGFCTFLVFADGQDPLVLREARLNGRHLYGSTKECFCANHSSLSETFSRRVRFLGYSTWIAKDEGDSSR